MTEKDGVIHDLTGRLTMAESNPRPFPNNNPFVVTRRTTKDPAVFTGDEKNISKRQIEYQTWNAQLRRNWIIDAPFFDTEFKKMMNIVGCMGGETARIYLVRFDNITKNATDPSGWAWRTAEDVLSTLDGQYVTIDLSHQANIDFDKEWMKGKPFPNFCARFVSLAEQSGKTSAQKVTEVRKRISDELAEAVKFQHTVPGDEDFEGWVNMLKSLWERQETEKHNSALRAANKTNNPFRQQQPQKQQQTQDALQVADKGDPMILDAAREKLTPGMRQLCVQKGLCFYCREQGHGVWNCPKKAAADARFGVTNNSNRAPATPIRPRSPYQQANAFQQPARQNNPYSQYQQPQFRNMQNRAGEHVRLIDDSTPPPSHDGLTYAPSYAPSIDGQEKE
jgi:hypothetical protein